MHHEDAGAPRAGEREPDRPRRQQLHGAGGRLEHEPAPAVPRSKLGVADRWCPRGGSCPAASRPLAGQEGCEPAVQSMQLLAMRTHVRGGFMHSRTQRPGRSGPAQAAPLPWPQWGSASAQARAVGLAIRPARRCPVGIAHGPPVAARVPAPSVGAHIVRRVAPAHRELSAAPWPIPPPPPSTGDGGHKHTQRAPSLAPATALFSAVGAGHEAPAPATTPRIPAPRATAALRRPRTPAGCWPRLEASWRPSRPSRCRQLPPRPLDPEPPIRCRRPCRSHRCRWTRRSSRPRSRRCRSHRCHRWTHRCHRCDPPLPPVDPPLPAASRRSRRLPYRRSRQSRPPPPPMSTSGRSGRPTVSTAPPPLRTFGARRVDGPSSGPRRTVPVHLPRSHDLEDPKRAGRTGRTGKGDFLHVRAPPLFAGIRRRSHDA